MTARRVFATQASHTAGIPKRDRLLHVLRTCVPSRLTRPPRGGRCPGPPAILVVGTSPNLCGGGRFGFLPYQRYRLENGRGAHRAAMASSVCSIGRRRPGLPVLSPRGFAFWMGDHGWLEVRARRRKAAGCRWHPYLELTTGMKERGARVSAA